MPTRKPQSSAPASRASSGRPARPKPDDDENLTGRRPPRADGDRPRSAASRAGSSRSDRPRTSSSDRSRSDRPRTSDGRRPPTGSPRRRDDSRSSDAAVARREPPPSWGGVARRAASQLNDPRRDVSSRPARKEWTYDSVPPPEI